MDTTKTDAFNGDETVHPHRPDPHTPDRLMPAVVVHPLLAPDAEGLVVRCRNGSGARLR